MLSIVSIAVENSAWSLRPASLRFVNNARIRVTSDGLKGSRDPTVRPLFQGERLLDFFFLTNDIFILCEGRLSARLFGVLLPAFSRVQCVSLLKLQGQKQAND